MQPDLLGHTVREAGGSEDLDHLVLADEQLLLGDEPPQTLRARRGGEGALVGPEFAEAADLIDGHAEIDLKALELRGVIVVDQGTELIDECRFVARPRGCDVDADTNDRGLLIVFVDVHEVELGPTAATIDQMLRRGMNMPADVENCLVVEFEARKARNFVLGVVWCPGRRKLPIEEITRNWLVFVSGEIGTVKSGKRGSR